MKNEVFGLHSMRKYSDGRIEKDGTLLFPTLERAENFLESVSKMHTTAKHGIRDGFAAHYEMDKSYIVSNFLADNVNTKRFFFVSQIGRYIEGADVATPSEDVEISSIVLSPEIEQEYIENKKQEN